MADLTPEAIAELRRLNEERIQFQDWLSTRSTSKRAGWVNAAAEQWMNAATEKFPALLDAAERCASAEAALKHKETGYEILAGTYKAILEQLVGLKAQAKAAGEMLRAANALLDESDIIQCDNPSVIPRFLGAIAAAERAGVKP